MDNLKEKPSQDRFRCNHCGLEDEWVPDGRETVCGNCGKGEFLLVLDTSYHKKRLAERLADPEFRAEYERARREIAMRKIKAVSIDGEKGAWGGAENGVRVVFREGFGNKDHEYEWRMSTWDALDVIARIAAVLDRRHRVSAPRGCSGGRHK